MAWIICALLAITVIALSCALAISRRNVKKLSRLVDETLSLGVFEEITLDTSDKRLNGLVAALNRELARFRELKNGYLVGDRELKEAVANVAHDLRTPLTAIYGYIDLLSRQENPPETQKYIAAIENRVAAITHLTEELFEFTSISSSGVRAVAPTDIRRVLEETLIASYPIFEQRGIVPVIETPDAAVIRDADPNALARVFSNIISNAAKYSERDFSVIMTDDGTVSFTNRATGLSANDVSKLFDRFFTADPSRHSTGLGLSIAKTLVEQMGGTIFADYVDDKLSIVLHFDPKE